MSSGTARWLSLHLDLPADEVGRGQLYGPAGDAVADEVVRPLVTRLRAEGRLRRYFFIRYYDPTPHLRLRLLGAEAEAPELDRQVRRACDSADLPWGRGSLRVRQVPYEPELERYGGPSGIEFSEALFAASSDLVLDLLPVLRSAGRNPELRFGHGVMGALLLAGCLLGDAGGRGAHHFFSSYAEGGFTRPGQRRQGGTERLRTEVLDIVDRQDELCARVAPVFVTAREPERLPEPLATAAEAFRRIREGLIHAWEREPFPVRGTPTASAAHAIGRLTGSYLHMHLNRLGVLPIHESLVCAVAARALSNEVVAA